MTSFCVDHTNISGQILNYLVYLQYIFIHASLFANRYKVRVTYA